MSVAWTDQYGLDCERRLAEEMARPREKPENVGRPLEPKEDRPDCPQCERPMVSNGKSITGDRRWRCPACKIGCANGTLDLFRRIVYRKREPAVKLERPAPPPCPRCARVLEPASRNTSGSLRWACAPCGRTFTTDAQGAFVKRGTNSEIKAQVIELRKTGMPFHEIGRHYGHSHNWARRIVEGTEAEGIKTVAWGSWRRMA